MRIKKPVKIICGTLAFILIGLLLFCANSFVGNPISKLAVKIDAMSYIQKTYPDEPLSIESVSYDFKFSSYCVKVSSKNSKDTRFSLRYTRFCKMTYDSYEQDVANKGNTFLRLDDQYRTLFENVLNEFDAPCKIDFAFAELKSTQDNDPSFPSKNYGIDKNTLVLDKEYDISALAKTAGHVVLYAYADKIDTKLAADTLLKVKKYLDKHGVPFYAIDFTLYQKAEGEEKAVLSPSVDVAEFLYSDIYEDGLESRVDKAVQERAKYYEERDKEKQKELELDKEKLKQVIDE